MTPMALDLDLAQIRDTTRWFDKRAGEFLPPHLSSCATGGALATGPATFDVRHPKTALFFGTAYGFTATVPGIDDASEAALNRDVPKGYTTLQTYEKRAVVAPDGVLRIWPRAYDSPAQEFRLIVPAAGNQRYLDLGATPGIRFAVLDAVNLAARVGQPVLVARLLSSRPWH